MTPQDRRAHLVDVALELYQRMPPEDVGVEDVTAAADVSRALFYRYFPNPGALHVAALGTIVDELVSGVALPVTGPLPEQLAAAVDTFLDVAQRHARAYVALLRSGSVISTGETDALVDGVRDHIVALLVERGGVPSPGVWQLMTLRDWLVAQLFGLLEVTARHEPG